MEFVAGAPPLGLIIKLVMAPLWRVLEEKETSVTGMSRVYSELVAELTAWASDSSSLLDGSARPFADATVGPDRVLDKLLEPSEAHDALTAEILQAVCTVLASFSTRLLADHLPGGKFNTPSTDLQQQTTSVLKTNAVSESDFAQFDRLLREKPNAHTVALEGMIMFSNNKTGAWLQSRTEAERGVLLKLARQAAPDLRSEFKKRRQAILDYRTAELKRKEDDIVKKREKELRRKEKLTEEVSKYGLWISPDQVATSLVQLRTVSEKRAALRAQLLFRKYVLQQRGQKELFQLSKDGKQYSVTEL